MEPRERTYTTQENIEGVPVIGFADRGSLGLSPDSTYDQDVSEFKSRMQALGEGGRPVSAVVDFSNYRMTDYDNGRAVLSHLMIAHKRLTAQGGGLSVCHHPVQLNPDLQHVLHFDKMISIYRSLGEALDAARSRRKSEADSSTGGSGPFT